MKALFKIEYTYQSYKTSSYDGSVINKECEMFLELDSDGNKPVYVPTNRLAGFENASIKITEATYIRNMHPVEVNDFDLERNELSVLISLDDFLESTLNHDQSFEDSVLAIMEARELDVEDALESLGYVQRVHDNSYNYCSDLENDIDYKVYTLTEDDGSEWFYDDTAIVLVNEHQGLDARAGYVFKGIYKGLDHDGLVYFLDMHIGARVVDSEWNEISDYEKMDGSLSRLCEDYELVSMSENQEIKVKSKEDGEIYTLCFETPAYGV